MHSCDHTDSESHHTVSDSRSVHATHTMHMNPGYVGHVRSSKEEVRLKIAGKLVQGVTYDKILDDIRKSVSDNFKRIHLIQRKDINNMERAFKLEWREVRGTMMMPPVLRHGWRR